MSAYVHIATEHKQITLNCPQCDIKQPYDIYRMALAACREHNLTVHPKDINWAA